MSEYESLARKYIEEIYGDGQISYIYDEAVDAVWRFAEWLDNQSSEGSAK